MKSRRNRRAERKRLALLFLAGFVWDAVITLDVLFTSQIVIPGAMVTTFAITIISATAYQTIIGDQGGKVPRILSLAAGSAVGAGLILWLF